MSDTYDSDRSVVSIYWHRPAPDIIFFLKIIFLKTKKKTFSGEPAVCLPADGIEVGTPRAWKKEA